MHCTETALVAKDLEAPTEPANFRVKYYLNHLSSYVQWLLELELALNFLEVVYYVDKSFGQIWKDKWQI